MSTKHIILPAVVSLTLACVSIGGCRRSSGDPPVAPKATPPPSQTAASSAAAGPSGVASALPPAASDAPVFDLHLLQHKRGARRPTPDVPRGQPVVVGGFVRGLTPSKRGAASFRMRFHVTAGGKKLGGWDGPVGAAFDVPEERALRVDIGLPIPADAPLGAAVLDLEIEEPGRPKQTASYAFRVVAPAAAPSPPPAPAPVPAPAAPATP